MTLKMGCRIFLVFNTYFLSWQSTQQNSAGLTWITVLLCFQHNLPHGADIHMCRVTTITCLHFFFLPFPGEMSHYWNGKGETQR